MAVTAEQLQVRISSEGGGEVASNISKVGRSARDAAVEVSDLGGELGDAARSATTMIVPLRAAAGAVDKLGDELAETGGRAVAAGGMMGSAASGAWTLTGGLTAATFASMSLKGSLISLALVALPFVATAAAPVVGVLTGLVGAFGAILGTGFLAWSSKAGNSLKSLKKEIVPLLKQFGQKFIPLIDAAVRALPKFIQKILDATGNLKPFINALKALGGAVFRIIPKLIKLFTDLARQALPLLREMGGYISKNLTPWLKELMRLGRRSGRALTEIGIAAFKLLKPLGSVVGWIGRLVGALFNLGKAVTGAGGDFNKTFGRVKTVIRNGIGAAVKWIKTTAIPLTTQALKFLAKKAVQGFNILKRTLPPLIRQGLRAAFNWVRTKGVSLAKRALSALWKGAKTAFNWLKTDGKRLVRQGIVRISQWIMGPATKLTLKALKALWSGAKKTFGWVKTDGVRLVKQGLTKILKWVKGPGAKATKRAFDVYLNRWKRAFNWFKTDGLPVVKRGLRAIWNWVKGPGVSLAKSALNTLWQRAKPAFNWLKRHGARLIRQGINQISNWLRTKGFSLFKKAFRTIGRKIGPAVTTILNTVSKVFKNAIPRIRNWLRNNGTDIIKKGFKAIGTGIRLLLKGMLAIGGLIGTAIVSGINGIRDWLKDGGARKLKNAFINIVSGIVSYLINDAFGDLKGAAEFLFGAIMAAAQGLYQGLIGNSLIPDMIADIASYLRNDAASDLANAAEQAASSMANGLINKFNQIMPNRISVPRISIGGGSIDLPSVSIGGRTIGGGRLDVPSLSVGGQSLRIPQLASGGFIESDGLAMLHAGERVVRAAEVDRDGSGATNINITVHADRQTDGRQVGRDIVDELRSRGLNG